MKIVNQLICPVSPERVDENRVRLTALGVIFTMDAFLFTGNALFPGLLVMDFYIRAFTRLSYSPLSWIAYLFIRILGTGPVWIPKAPKMFAARLGLLLSVITLTFALTGVYTLAYITGIILVVFAFLECGLNFCTGCWIYTYMVFPLFRK